MTTSLTSLPNSSAARGLALPDIAFVGKAGAGKSTAAEELAQFGYETRSFADPIRRLVVLLWGEEAKDDRAKITALGEAARSVDPDVWVNKLVDQIRPANSYQTLGLGSLVRRSPIAVDDCRTEAEWFALKGEGFAIVRISASRGRRIDRLKASGKWQNEEQLDGHLETAVDHLEADYTIDNVGSKSDLADDLVDVLIKARRRT